MDWTSSSWLNPATLANLACHVIGTVSQIAVIVVVARVVRRHRPDAYKPLLAWAIAAPVSALALTVVSTIVLFTFDREGIESMRVGMAATSVAGAVVQLVLAVLLIRGLVAIAQPPKPLILEPSGPFR